MAFSADNFFKDTKTDTGIYVRVAVPRIQANSLHLLHRAFDHIRDVLLWLVLHEVREPKGIFH